MRLVRFRGRAHHLPNDSMAADPIPGVWYVGERPAHVTAPCFTELVFDRALAQSCGRTCGEDCDGDCFAEMYTAVANINDARLSGRHKNEALFECYDPNPAPAVAPTPKPMRRAARAAKE